MDVKTTKTTSPIVVYSIVVALSIIFLVFNSINQYINYSIKFVGNILLYPIILISQTTSQTIDSITSNWENFTKNLEKIKRLEKENEELRKKASLVDYYETENRKLSILLNLSQSLPYKVEVANIISGGFDSSEEIIIIDKGTAHGITKNMPVIAYFLGNIALVGIVRETYLTTSIVETLISPNINIGVFLETSQEVGVLSGNGKINGTATVRYLSENVNIKVGTEKVYTFSKSINYPPGILIGTVMLTKKRERSRFQEAIVKPTIDIKNISSVMVIKSK